LYINDYNLDSATSA
nr:1,4-beta-D-xylan xylanohydrolase, endo 1,4-beta-xylanase {peptide 3} {EC 3.2.1.8} [Penicillium chrysogenum, Q 176, Peptide Partial, 14 aa] [Penicillium chrysogenum]